MNEGFGEWPRGVQGPVSTEEVPVPQQEVGERERQERYGEIRRRIAELSQQEREGTLPLRQWNNETEEMEEVECTNYEEALEVGAGELRSVLHTLKSYGGDYFYDPSEVSDEKLEEVRSAVERFKSLLP